MQRPIVRPSSTTTCNGSEGNGAHAVMKDRPPRLTRAHLDDLLDGRPTAENPLADLVAAVRAPAQQHELSGLDAALAAFAAAPTGAESSEDSSPAFKRVAGRLLALKALAVAAGPAVAGGVASAAVNGTLDSPSGSNSSAVASDSSGAPGSSRAGSSAPGSDKSSDQPGSGSKT